MMDARASTAHNIVDVLRKKPEGEIESQNIINLTENYFNFHRSEKFKSKVVVEIESDDESEAYMTARESNKLGSAPSRKYAYTENRSVKPAENGRSRSVQHDS